MIFFFKRYIFYNVIIITDDVISVGELKINMIWNHLTKPINVIYQSAKSVKNSIFSCFFLFWWRATWRHKWHFFYKPMDFSWTCWYIHVISMTIISCANFRPKKMSKSRAKSCEQKTRKKTWFFYTPEVEKSPYLTS